MQYSLLDQKETEIQRKIVLRLKSELRESSFFAVVAVVVVVVTVVTVVVVVIDKTIYRRREKSEVKINISQICFRTSAPISLKRKFK